MLSHDCVISSAAIKSKLRWTWCTDLTFFTNHLALRQLLQRFGDSIGVIQKPDSMKVVNLVCYSWYQCPSSQYNLTVFTAPLSTELSSYLCETNSLHVTTCASRQVVRVYELFCRETCQLHPIASTVTTRVFLIVWSEPSRISFSIPVTFITFVKLYSTCSSESQILSECHDLNFFSDLIDSEHVTMC